MITKFFGRKVFYRLLTVSFVFCVIIVSALRLADKVEAAANPLDILFGSGGKVIYEIGAFTTSTEDIAIQPDGKIVIVGHAWSGITSPVFTLSRYNPDGSPDLSFSGDGVVSGAFTDYPASQAYSVAIQPDGKIIVVGNAWLGAPPYQAFGVARFNPDGSFDTTFDGDGKTIFNIATQGDIAREVAIQPSGKILISGVIYYNEPPTGPSNICTVRLDLDGSLDTTFANGGYACPSDYAFPRALMVQPDGKFYAVARTSIGGYSNALILRYNTDGSPDTTFDGDGKLITQLTESSSAGPNAAVLQPDGKFIIGTSQIVAGHEDYNFVLVRFNADGSRDTSFDGDGTAMVSFGVWQDALINMAIQPDGKIVAVGGRFNGQASTSNTQDFAVARLNTDGSLDNTFGQNGKFVTPVGTGNEYAEAVAIQSNGKIVVAGNAYTPPNNNRWSSVLVGYMGDVNTADFDGDTRTDLSIFRPSLGEWWLLKSSDGGNAAFGFGNSADKLVPGDYTGDGKTDIAVFRPASGEWFILRSNNNSYYSFPFGLGADIPAPADYDGDGKFDAAVFRPSNSTWYINNSSGGTTIQQFGQNADVPAPADYDGDGKSDIAIYRVALGEWWILKSSNGGNTAYQFGASSDKPVPADFTGDGKADPAFWRASSGEWFILRSENGSYYSFPFGSPTDIPAPADYDGDRKFDAAVFRPSTANWFIQRSTAGTIIQTFGQNGDVPVPSVSAY